VKIGAFWGAQQEKAFLDLKEKLTISPVLCYPDFSKEFIVETDASHAGLGAVLSQEQGGQRRVVAYASRGLRPNERKIETFSSMKIETLALAWAVGVKFKDYLQISPFRVITDNNPLTYFMSKEKLSAQEQKWAATLSRYEFTIEYRSGQHNTNADALSRQEHRNWDKEEPNETCAMIACSTRLPVELQSQIIEEIIGQESVFCQQQEAVFTLLQEATSLPTLTLDGVSKLQDQDPVLSVLKKWIMQGTKVPSHEKREESKVVRMLYRQKDRLFLKEGVLSRKVNDPRMGNLTQVMVPEILKIKLMESLSR
jgi:hypothetical protein